MKVKHSNKGVTLIKYDLTTSKILLTFFTILFTVIFFPYFYDDPLEFYKNLESGNYPSLIKIIISFYLFYWNLVLWFNKTYIFANDEVITIKYKPIPYIFFCNKTIRRNRLKKLYIKEKRKKTSGDPNSSGGYYNYYLRALMNNGADKRLLTFSSKEGFPTRKYELFSLGKLLRENLNIEVEAKPASKR